MPVIKTAKVGFITLLQSAGHAAELIPKSAGHRLKPDLLLPGNIQAVFYREIIR
jgi:hypothetical protein